MRPPAGGNAIPASSSKAVPVDLEPTTPLANPPSGVPTTFFLATESMLSASEATIVGTSSEENYGVRSLEETIEEVETPDEKNASEQGDNHGIYGARRRFTIRPRVYESREHSSDSLGQDSILSSTASSPPRFPKLRPRRGSGSAPMTPISYTSPTMESSMPGSPKSMSSRSLLHSDEDSADDGASQAIVSSGDEDGESPPRSQGQAPQLIMPSLMMPIRRPFTERGKALGRLKVLLAGGSGAGKTSLIKSIVQVCEDIVHVDALSSTTPSLQNFADRKGKGITGSTHFNPTKSIMEIYASTRAYPSWWSDLGESTILRRRKSAGETVLERNLCFVDTPGYDCGPSTGERMEAVVQYIETQMTKTISMTSMGDGDLLNVLCGNGGFHVDVVFYLITQNLKLAEIEFLKRLNQMTNVIPLIAKADTISADEVAALKNSVSIELQNAGIHLFAFSSNTPGVSSIYTVCSSRSNDEDNMDASLLMSSGYVQPLLPSELGDIMSELLNNDHPSWLKHTAAKKILQWRKTSRTTASMPSPLQTTFPSRNSRALGSPISPTFPSPTSSSFSHAIISTSPGPFSYNQARLADHTHREERLAQVHLANWAGNLQRSLQNERARYEALARRDQAAWLLAKMDQCVLDSSLSESEHRHALTSCSELKPNDQRGTTPSILASTRGMALHYSDPLGLMRLHDVLRRQGWEALQIVGLGGLFGVVVWAVRNWGLDFGIGGGVWRGVGEQGV